MQTVALIGMTAGTTVTMTADDDATMTTTMMMTTMIGAVDEGEADSSLIFSISDRRSAR